MSEVLKVKGAREGLRCYSDNMIELEAASPQDHEEISLYGAMKGCLQSVFQISYLKLGGISFIQTVA